MKASEIITELHALSNQRNREGMARFGIWTQQALGVSMPHLRQLAQRIGKHDHALAVAIETAQEILMLGGKGTWVASDALRELRSEKVQAKFRHEHSTTRRPA